MLNLSGDYVAVNRRAREAARKDLQVRQMRRKTKKALVKYWELWRKRVATHTRDRV